MKLVSDDTIQMLSYREEAARQTRQVKQGREVFQEGGRCCSNGRWTCSKRKKRNHRGQAVDTEKEEEKVEASREVE